MYYDIPKLLAKHQAKQRQAIADAWKLGKLKAAKQAADDALYADREAKRKAAGAMLLTDVKPDQALLKAAIEAADAYNLERLRVTT